MNNSANTPKSRAAKIEYLKQTTFDLVILGGGATGAGIALDAASRGIKTALIEKKDFAAGTSSKSTKLIHGGLRYLKQLDIQLVRETGTERAILHKLAPHLVLPEKMLMPLIKGGNYGYWSTSFGLKVYDILADVKDDDRRQMLNKKEAIAREPLLDDRNLKGAGYYAEYRTDDARLTIEIIKTAARYDATVINYCEGHDFVYGKNDMIEGVRCIDHITQEAFTISADTVVSATGPWVDGLRKKNGFMSNKKLHLTKGIHIVVPHHKFPLRQTVYFDVPDGRMIFAIPRGRTTYIGTTDTTYHGDLNHIVCTKDDVDYLLRAVNSVFPKISLSIEDIQSNWAGLRPLIHQDGKSPSELSRKDEIFESPNGLISIAGGKLTGYRKMAERIVDRVAKRRAKSKPALSKCTTAKIALTSEVFENIEAVQSYIERLTDQMPEGLDAFHARYLVSTYGQQAVQIFENMDRFDHYSPEIALACAEVQYGIHHEYVASATDFFVRRTGKLFFEIGNIPVIREAVFDLLSNELHWDATRIQSEHTLLDRWIKDATTYYPS